jgi:hypothetical protein
MGKTQGSKKMGYDFKKKTKQSTKILTDTYLSILSQRSHGDGQTNGWTNGGTNKRRNGQTDKYLLNIQG